MLPGWHKTNRMRCCSLVLMSSFATPLYAAQATDTISQHKAEEMPDMALLEYLAELVEVDGELVGPMELADKLEKNENEQSTEQSNPVQKKPAQTDKNNQQEDKEHD